MGSSCLKLIISIIPPVMVGMIKSSKYCLTVQDLWFRISSSFCKYCWYLTTEKITYFFLLLPVSCAVPLSLVQVVFVFGGVPAVLVLLGFLNCSFLVVVNRSLCKLQILSLFKPIHFIKYKSIIKIWVKIINNYIEYLTNINIKIRKFYK